MNSININIQSNKNENQIIQETWKEDKYPAYRYHKDCFDKSGGVMTVLNIIKDQNVSFSEITWEAVSVEEFNENNAGEEMKNCDLCLDSLSN